MVDQVVYQRQAPFIEERAEQLLASVMGVPLAPGEPLPEKLPGETEEEYQLRIKGLAGIPQAVPAQQIAPLTQAQQTAVEKAQEGLGVYQPFLDAASTTVGAGLGAIGAGVQQLDPSQVSTFMDPYQQQVTQQALAELDRQAAMQGQRTAAEAVAAGAFGGSRFGVREAEEARNLAQVKSQRIFEDLSRNFLQAQQAQQRTAQQLGQLGVQTLQAGQAQVGLGEAGQRLGGVDINRLLSIGGVQQQQEQNVLEAARRTELARQQEPFRRATFASDVLRGVPSSQIRYTESPAPSLLQQVAGLGIAGLSTLGALGGTGGISSLLG